MKKSPRDKSIGAQMAILIQLMKRKNHQAIANAGFKLTLEQMAVLEELSRSGDMNMTELSKAVWKQNANITRIVDKLEKRGLVVRKSVEGDRRANLLSVTKEGKILFKKIIPHVIGVYKEATSVITDAEEATMFKVLKKMIEHLS